MQAIHPCPDCGRPAEAVGTATVDGRVLPVYQCPVCLRDVDPGDGGPPLAAALTFSITTSGAVVRIEGTSSPD